MIKDKCFNREWFESFRKDEKNRRINTTVLEKMIRAFHLLEMIQIYGLDFIFKGGTSLVLLLEEDNRFSIDVDIICATSREKLGSIFDEMIRESRFEFFTFDERRSQKPGVPKYHYYFHYSSALTSRKDYIMLDILHDRDVYPEVIPKQITSRWIESRDLIEVKTPTIDAITGDKLTAFAPDTTGIPYYKDETSFSMEIIKQLFDLDRLFNSISSMEVVAESFKAHVMREISYRKHKSEFKYKNVDTESVLRDTIKTCLIITRRERNEEDEDKDRYRDLLSGIKRFGTGFLMSGRYRLDEAVSSSAKVAYLAAKILAEDMTPIDYYDGQDISNLEIKGGFRFFNRLRRLPDKSVFYYWYKAIELIDESLI